MTKVFKIKIGKHQTGIMDLDQVLKEMAKAGQGITDQQIGALMVVIEDLGIEADLEHVRDFKEISK